MALAGVLALAGGCSSAGSSAASAGGSSPLASAGRAASAASPGHSSPAASAGHSAPATSDTLTPAHREALADRYLAIAVPANHRLDHEVEGSPITSAATSPRPRRICARKQPPSVGSTGGWRRSRFRPGSPRWLAR
jgi:hypothetical protein